MADTPLRDQIMSAITDIPTLDDIEREDDEPTDEIVEAIRRQLVVLQGTAVVIGNMATMLQAQIANLTAEVDLFSQPPQQSEPADPPLKRTASGAIVESSLPEAKRQVPEWCTHEDVLIVDTADGPVRVCPECVVDRDGDPGA